MQVNHLAAFAGLILGLIAAVPNFGQDLFHDDAAATGLDFVHQNGMSGEVYFAEMMGPGVALFDLDSDGDFDVYVPQGHPLVKAVGPSKSKWPSDRLYRNELVNKQGSSALRFVDISAAAGLAAGGYGMGVTSGDFDNDGRPDLYVTNYGENRLLKNRGKGTFEDVTLKAGAGDPRWSVSAAFFDYDRDGWLDLYVGNYVASTLANHVVCQSITGEADYCGPQVYPSEYDRLLRNRGDGTFEDVSAKALVGRVKSSTLGVVTADFNGDGWIDVYVANDLMPNQLWLNQQDGTFIDEAVLGGAAANGEGVLEASMGVVAEDLDSDGDIDLFMTHLNQQTNTFYANDGQGFFKDATLASGLGTPSWKYTGFGTGAFDYDNDGHFDLLIANGAVKHKQELLRAGDSFPLHEPNQLFRNLGSGRFEEVSSRAGKAFELSEVSRGVAVGDVDNDGDVDALVINNHGPARLLLNDVGNRKSWLGLRLIDRHGRDALGARVALERRGAPTVWRRVAVDGSYGSANDPRVLIGLGEKASIERLRVFWPDGTRETWAGLEPGKYHRLVQGEGKPEQPSKAQEAPATGVGR